jgi:ribonuclease HI
VPKVKNTIPWTLTERILSYLSPPRINPKIDNLHDTLDYYRRMNRRAINDISEYRQVPHMNFFFDANLYSSVFSKKAIAKPELASTWIATWRDMDGLVRHETMNEATTNNQAEYGSMIRILRHLRLKAEGKEPLKDSDWWLDEAVIYGDSQVVIHQMNGKYHVNEPVLKSLWLEAVNLVHILATEYHIKVRFQWIPRDINNEVLGLTGKIKQMGPE